MVQCHVLDSSLLDSSILESSPTTGDNEWYHNVEGWSLELIFLEMIYTPSKCKVQKGKEKKGTNVPLCRYE